MSAEDFEVLRQHMLAEIFAGTFLVRGLIGKAALDERVMTAMGKVPRHEFVPIELRPYAYANVPLPIGFDKTISQPFIVALMTDLLDISADDTVLEIGTGLGYQAAILAQLARKVYSIEVIEELGDRRSSDSIGRAAPTSSSRSPMAVMAGPSTRRSTR
jgi:protein-L-isoaspartate(D-aspartate) O-methyltransferase